ncbi:alpha/beta hydrolase family protein [Kineococcus glutinatus]|uniref:CocE/NonD family hydrolase n=1 Tax=Kineococcus glutinatus TaxID=1070872 RepID=A0ABP9HSH8_9ACTN
MTRTILRGLAVLAALALGLGLLVAAGNDYRFEEERVVVPVPGGALEAVVARPRGTARGLVVFVHGDGPVDATHDGLYRPWFEAAADAGFATLSWSKPGVGASSGNWLSQSMDERAAEVSHVLGWAAAQPDLPTGTTVLWGASQAGWVLPQVVRTRSDVDAVVAVSPAVNWLRQGRFNLLAELDHAGADEAAREEAVAASDRTRALLESGADHTRYLARTTEADPMDAERWGFVARNFRADATADLEAAAARHLPVLLTLGSEDRNVDVDETEATYRRILGDDVTVARFEAAHSMARPAVEESDALGLLAAVARPRALLAPGVLSTYRDFLAALAPPAAAGTANLRMRSPGRP